MTLILLTLALQAAAPQAAAPDDWTRVVELAEGSEVRVHRRGAAVLTGKLDRATSEFIAVVTKSETLSIDRESVLRVDSRPPGAGSTVTKKSSGVPPDPAKPPATVTRPRQPGEPPVRRAATAAQPEWSSGVTWSSGKDFQTIYRRR